MAGTSRKSKRSGVRLRLVVSLPILIFLVAISVTIFVSRYATRVLQDRALNYHIELARNLIFAAEREMIEDGVDLLAALGDQVGFHEQKRLAEGVRFVLFRTPPAAPFLPYDPTGEITQRDQTQLLNLTSDLASPQIIDIGLQSRQHLATAHRAIENGYYLIALEPYRNIRDISRWILGVSIVITLMTAVALLTIAWIMTAPLHRLAKKTRELAQSELLDQRAVDEIIELSKEPEEVAALALALEHSLNALVDLKRSIHGIIESMEGGVLALDSEGYIQQVNSAARQIMGLEGTLIGKQVGQIIPSPEENQTFISILEELLVEQITFGRTREIEFRNGRGEISQLGVATSLVPDNSGGILNAVVVMVNLTEMIELKERLRRADRMSSLGSMATKVAHEIRNPLGSVKGLGQLALESLEEGSEPYQYLERIVREVDRLSNIVGELLEYSQRRPLTLESADVNEIVKEGLEMARFRIGERGPTFLQELDLSLQPMRMDRNRLLQAFLNIVVNALQAVGNDGAVTIATYREEHGDRVVIEVSDNGPGIPPDVLEHIFDPFYTTKEHGSGLGLSISHTILREHQGRLEVESKVGQGTTFRIILQDYRIDKGISP
ncbi:nitrogen regulation protein NR(II) [Candidatus Zixiibacteriota bacterium]